MQDKTTQQNSFSDQCIALWTHGDLQCDDVVTIEGLHDAVRTYTRMTLPRFLVFFLYGAV